MASIILNTQPLSTPWPGVDPFLFCAHHLDHYPAGDAGQGVEASVLTGRDIGHDFSRKDGFSLYHGSPVPGFPAHPHRGFETVTIVPQGLVDHADSLGATARYGEGDVQWLTTGKGVQHSEMFPLRHRNRDNPLNLYQLWLNLPAASKMVDPAFTMMWDADIPVYRTRNAAGAEASVKVVAGRYQPQDGGEALTPPPPPSASWAARPEADVAIWLVRLDAGASLTLPPSNGAGASRTLYVHGGHRMEVDGQDLTGDTLVRVRADAPTPLHNTGATPVDVLVLQAVPIGEPVVAHGPFVMNTAEEVQQAFSDYRQTGFGGWPWDTAGPVHSADHDRFAMRPGGGIETPAT
jgi:redox-sensitive bicupin YhaK (pirin superfamily)